MKNKAPEMNLKVGCCGFPAKKQDYYEKLNIIEVQQTFYQPPRVEISEKWRLSAPENFEFIVKAWQLITHESSSPTYRRMRIKMDDRSKKNCGFFKTTDEVFRAWEETEKAASALGAKVIVFQCPSSFMSSKTNKDNLRKFFGTIDRKNYKFVWEPRGNWQEAEIKEICEESDLVHCVDPFKARAVHGDIRYFHLHGIEGSRHRYRGWDLKRLRDFCEDDARTVKGKAIYVLFNNMSMLNDAQRFEWIIENTGRIREMDFAFLRGLCREIETEEEDEKVQQLSREADRIVLLILHTDYARVDIEIEKSKLRELCRKLFPNKDHLYEMIYAQRFDRLWEQFRGKK